MALGWLYLLNASILAALAWLLRDRSQVREGPAAWFMAWLCMGVITNILLLVSRAVPDDDISRSFWLAGYSSVNVLLLLLLLFVRSFTGGGRFRDVFWSLPALFSISVIILGGSSFSLRDQGVWRFELACRASLLPRSVMIFYALAAMALLAALYANMREGGTEAAERGVKYLLWALVIMFVTNAASPFVRQYVSPQLPIGEVGFTVGALLIALDLSWMKAGKKKSGAPT